MSLKKFSREVTRERMFLAKDATHVKVSRPERMCMFRRYVENKRILGSTVCQDL